MTSGLTTQIRGTFEALEDAQAPVTAEEVLRRANPKQLVPDELSPSVAPSRRVSLVVAIVAAAATLVAIGAVAWVAPLNGDAAPAGEPVVTTTLAVSPLPPGQEITVTWQERPIDGQEPYPSRAIVHTSFGYLGTDRFDALWSSADGFNWKRSLPDLKGVSVASNGAMTLVSGIREGVSVLFRSEDGVEWSEIDRSEVPANLREVVATTPTGITWFRSASNGQSSGVLGVVDAARVTTIHEPPWKETGCCSATTLAQVGDNVVAYQYNRNDLPFSHAWEYLGNRQWSATLNVPFSEQHAVVGDTMLRFDHTNAGCCGSPIPGESLWPLFSSNDGFSWTEVGQIPGKNAHSLRVNAGSSFWVYGPDIGGGGDAIEAMFGTSLGISVDGQHWQEIDVPAGMDQSRDASIGQVHVAGDLIFITGVSHDGFTTENWVGVVETN